MYDYSWMWAQIYAQQQINLQEEMWRRQREQEEARKRAEAEAAQRKAEAEAAAQKAAEEKAAQEAALKKAQEEQAAAQAYSNRVEQIRQSNDTATDNEAGAAVSAQIQTKRKMRGNSTRLTGNLGTDGTVTTTTGARLGGSVRLR